MRPYSRRRVVANWDKGRASSFVAPGRLGEGRCEHPGSLQIVDQFQSVPGMPASLKGTRRHCPGPPRTCPVRLRSPDDGGRPECRGDPPLGNCAQEPGDHAGLALGDSDAWRSPRPARVRAIPAAAGPGAAAADPLTDPLTDQGTDPLTDPWADQRAARPDEPAADWPASRALAPLPRGARDRRPRAAG
jgi:hypothetical protein